MKPYTIILLLALAGCAAPRETAFSKLPATVNETYPLWEVNGAAYDTNGAFSLIYSEASPEDIHIPHWRRVLNGDSYELVSCRGNLLPHGGTGFAVGTAVEGPTMGRLAIYDENLKLAGSTGCQKVVRMKLLDLLNDGQLEIVTWEDHHYGTMTTRRMLNIYRVDKNHVPQCVFAQDLFVPGWRPWGTATEDNFKAASARYSINFTARMAQKQIVVIGQNGCDDRTVYIWDGTHYAKSQ